LYTISVLKIKASLFLIFSIPKMRGKELTDKQRERIIGAHLAGVNGLKISSDFNISSTTVYDTINRYKKSGSPHPKKRSGRPKMISVRGKRFLQRIVLKDRFLPLEKITNQLNQDLNTTYHPNTVRKYLHNLGLKGHATRNKPLLTNRQRISRLKWCQIKRSWCEEWKQIVWSDESRFTLFKSDGRVKVWRRVGEAYNKNCIKPTVKFGGGSVMFWGCFSWHGVGPLVVVEENMDSDVYVNVLANNLIPWVRNNPNIIFQQDRAPCHMSSYTTWWMTTHGIPLLDWVSQSPDINPIEHLWDHLDRQIRKRKPLPKTKQELIGVVQEEWANINIEILHRLILSVPKRIKDIIKAKGGHIKY
jgi:transposase